MGLFGHPAAPNHDPAVREKALADERAAKLAQAIGDVEGLEERIMAFVKAAGLRGARWDELLDAIGGDSAASVHDEANRLIEDKLNEMMDRGMLYEPTLGILKEA